MKIHGEFYATKRKAKPFELLMNGQKTFDGGYARVSHLTPFSVLKATCCQSTNELLSDLEKRTKKGLPTPVGLPAVLANHGQSMEDGEGMKYHLWEIERLFEPHDELEIRKARISGRSVLATMKPSYASQVARLTPKVFNELVEDLRLAQEPLRGIFPSWDACKEVALALSLKTSGELKNTFLYLHDFVVHHRVSLDLLTQGNVMVNCFGYPCLSDPVCESYDSMGISADFPRAEGVDYCVLAMLPVSIQGLQVSLKPFCTEAICEASASSVLQALKEEGVQGEMSTWRSSAHVKHLTAPMQTAPVWDFPEVCEKLARGQYIKALSNQ